MRRYSTLTNFLGKSGGIDPGGAVASITTKANSTKRILGIAGANIA